MTTTYSLNLTAMLIAPMTFAFASMDETAGIDDRDPAQLLDAIQRFMGRTTVFCQAAGIHVPTTHSRIHTFLEGSLHQVEPPRGRPVPPQALGHPVPPSGGRRAVPPRRRREPQPHPRQLVGHGPDPRRGA